MGTKPQTIVVKIGSSSIIDDRTGQVKLTSLSQLVETLSTLRISGHRVVLVSSGAVGVGLLRMNMKEKPKTLRGRQAAAAVGQGRLMKVYDDLFGYFDQVVAQVLLSRGDIAQRNRYTNAKNTLEELLDHGIIPVLNENDTTSVEELRFGDNDSLSAMVAAIVDADWLFLLTDVDALYDKNPNVYPDAKPIRVVDDIDQVVKEAKIEGAGSQWGTGGMETKITAARLATASGCKCVITTALRPNDIIDIINGDANKGTLFRPFQHPVKEKKRFISHGCTLEGTLYVDAGAAKGILTRNSLFPAGITKVEGTFPAQSGVVLVGPDGQRLGCGIANYSSQEIEQIKGLRSHKIAEVLGYHGDECVIYRHSLAVTYETH